MGAKPPKVTDIAAVAEPAVGMTAEGAAATAEQVEQAAGATIEQTAATAERTAAQATSGTGAAVEATQAKVKQGMEKAMKTAEEFVAFGQGNVEALVKSSQIWVSGVQDLSKSFAAAAQASMEEGISTFKALTSVKSMKEAFDLQAAYARSTLEKTVAESGKLTDASFKLTEQAMAPITARVTVVVEKFSKAA